MNVQFDSLTTLMLAVLCLLLGTVLKKHVKWLQTFCIPSPVIGGFLISLLMWFLHTQTSVRVAFDTTLQTPLMVAFFTTVGIGGSYQLLKTGGKTLIVYLFICWGLALFQNAFGAVLASWFGLNPVLGVMAGSVALEGGHGAAAAFGQMAEGLGVQSATTVAIAAATFGLISGSLIGGPLASFLITRYKVAIKADDIDEVVDPNATTEPISSHTFFKMLAVVLVIMVAGLYVATRFTDSTGFALPSYVGAMLVAIVLRNINDHTQAVVIHQKTVDLISDVSLGVFLTMAMMSLKIWELSAVALPLLIILLLQVVALVLFTIFIAFKVLGKNYDAAVMCAGLLGHGLGATPNAVANMASVSEKYKLVSKKAFLIIPLCGAVLIDIVAIPYHTWIINFLVNL